MWQRASMAMKQLLAAAGASHCDNVAVTHQGSPLVTLISTPRALLSGKRDRLLGVFPSAGVAGEGYVESPGARGGRGRAADGRTPRRCAISSRRGGGRGNAVARRPRVAGVALFPCLCARDPLLRHDSPRVANGGRSGFRRVPGSPHPCRFALDGARNIPRQADHRQAIGRVRGAPCGAHRRACRGTGHSARFDHMIRRVDGPPPRSEPYVPGNSLTGPENFAVRTPPTNRHDCHDIAGHAFCC